jgi:hypothetical protein
MRRILSPLLLGALLLAPAFLVVADNPATITITLIRNPDGTYNPQYRLGEKTPDPLTLTCDNSAQPTPVAGVVGTAFSYNVRQFFQGTGAAAATLSVATYSGDNATSEGWSIASAGAGDTLEHDGGETGAGVLQIIGTTGGDPVLCPLNITWSYTDPPTQDNPPSAPGTPVLNERTETTAQFSWPASTDDIGIASYKVYRAATSCANTFTLLGQQPLGTQTSLTQTGLSEASVGCYRVRAVDTAGQESSDSGTLLVGAYEPPSETDEAPYPRLAAYHQGTTNYADDSGTAGYQNANCTNMGSLDWVVLNWHAGVSRSDLTNCITVARQSRATLRPGRDPAKFFIYTNRDAIPSGAVWNTHRQLVQDNTLWASERTIGTLASGQLTRSNSTATVNTPVNHGLSSGNKVAIYGASPTAYNGVKTITVVDANTFTFSVSGSPSTPATGTISVRGPVVTIFSPSNDGVNETIAASVSGNLSYVEWGAAYAIDTWGVAGTGLDGIMADNMGQEALENYDYDRDGDEDSAGAAGFKSAIYAARQRHIDYVHSRGLLMATNSTLKQAAEGVFKEAVDIRPQALALGIDYHILEHTIGQWNSAEGVGFYDGSGTLSQLRTWPGNAQFGSTPATGTPIQSTFGRYYNSASPPASSIGVYNLYTLANVVADGSHVVAQVKGPDSSHFGDVSGAWAGSGQHARYSALLPQVISPFSTDYIPQNTSPRVVQRLDEFEFEWGQALQPPRTLADVVSTDCNTREFELALVIACHRQGQGASETFTNRSVTLPSAGSGKKWQRINAASFLNQAPSYNTGADQGSPISMPARSAIVLRRVNQ